MWLVRFHLAWAEPFRPLLLSGTPFVTTNGLRFGDRAFHMLGYTNRQGARLGGGGLQL